MQSRIEEASQTLKRLEETHQLEECCRKINLLIEFIKKNPTLSQHSLRLSRGFGAMYKFKNKEIIPTLLLSLVEVFKQLKVSRLFLEDNDFGASYHERIFHTFLEAGLFTPYLQEVNLQKNSLRFLHKNTWSVLCAKLAESNIIKLNLANNQIEDQELIAKIKAILENNYRKILTHDPTLFTRDNYRKIILAHGSTLFTQVAFFIVKQEKTGARKFSRNNLPEACINKLNAIEKESHTTPHLLTF